VPAFRPERRESAVGFRVFWQVDRSSRPQALAARRQVGQIDPQIEFQLVVIGCHVAAQLVESLVMLALLQVGKLTHKYPPNGHTKTQ